MFHSWSFHLEWNYLLNVKAFQCIRLLQCLGFIYPQVDEIFQFGFYSFPMFPNYHSEPSSVLFICSENQYILIRQFEVLHLSSYVLAQCFFSSFISAVATSVCQHIEFSFHLVYVFWTLICNAISINWLCLMRFEFLGEEICLLRPSYSTSRRTSLLLANGWQLQTPHWTFINKLFTMHGTQEEVISKLKWPLNKTKPMRNSKSSYLAHQSLVSCVSEPCCDTASL